MPRAEEGMRSPASALSMAQGDVAQRWLHLYIAVGPNRRNPENDFMIPPQAGLPGREWKRSTNAPKPRLLIGRGQASTTACCKT